MSEREEVLQVELLTPAGRGCWWSSEEEDYLIIGFAEYHCHFSNFQGTTAGEDAVNAAAFIRALHKGEVVLVVWYQVDTYAGSSIIEATEKPQTLLEGRNVTIKVKKWAE